MLSDLILLLTSITTLFEPYSVNYIDKDNYFNQLKDNIRNASQFIFSYDQFSINNVTRNDNYHQNQHEIFAQ